MTSTNDGKEVKSNQLSGPKGKTYYIELYKLSEAHLSGEGSVHDRTQHLCTAWRRIHSLCQHSTPKTHPYLQSWIQKHTAKLVLQTEWWQSPENKDEHSSLEQAIDAFIEDCQAAASSRNGIFLSWEKELTQRAEWFKGHLADPWAHPVLRVLLDPRGTEPSEREVVEWLKEEQGVVFVTRLRQLAASKCDDLALALATAVLDRVRATTTLVPDAEQCDKTTDNTKRIPKSPFAETLKNEADFTREVWELLVDIEFVLLHKGDKRSRCIELAKQTPLRRGWQLVERLENRLETSSREKKKEKLWKNAKDVATLIAQVIIARCMVVARCADVCHAVLGRCARALVRLLPPAKLPATADALAAPAATAAHLHALAAAIDAESKENMKPFVCVLYVRAITAGMNELERLKLKTEKAFLRSCGGDTTRAQLMFKEEPPIAKEPEARAMEQTLASWFVHLGSLLRASDRFNCECILTAFSIHPSATMYTMIKGAPALPPVTVDPQEAKEETTSEFGSWANDSRSQTNLVKTSETLNMKQAQQQANVLSTAILAEGEALGLEPDLCQDIAVLLSGPRVKTLSWDMDRTLLLENCKNYMERTHGGTRALTTELKFLNLDPREFEHLPEEDDEENDIYYGIEKGYEHLVEFEEPSIWSEDIKTNETTDTALSGSDDSVTPLSRRKKKSIKKHSVTSDDESDPLSSNVVKPEKKERPHSKERSKHRKKKVVDPLSFDDSQETKIKLKKEKKEKKLKNKEKHKCNTILHTINTNDLDVAIPKTTSVTDSDYDSQGKSSLHSNEDALDALCNHIKELKSSTNTKDKRVNFSNKEYLQHEDAVSRNKPSSSGVGYSVNKKMNTSSAINMSKPVGKPALNSVSEEVKRSLSRLIEERANLTVSKPMWPVENHEHKMPIAIARPSAPFIPTQINPKKIAIPEMEIPQSYIEKRVDSSSVYSRVADDLRSSKNISTKKASVVKTTHKPINNTEAYRQPLMVKEMIVQQQRANIKSETPCQNNFKDFLRELKETINAGTGSEPPWIKQKEEKRPISRVVPVIPNYKSELKTLHSAKLTTQKKDKNTLNTFSRLSYMHKNKIDKKERVQKVIEHQNNYLQHHPISEQNLDQLIAEHRETQIKYLYPNLDISKVAKNKTVADANVKEQQKSINRNPLLTNLLQTNTQINLDRQDSFTLPKATGLSEQDQIDLLHLLRQKNKLNSPVLSRSEESNVSQHKSVMNTNISIPYSVKQTTNDPFPFNVDVEAKATLKELKEAAPSSSDIRYNNIEKIKLNEISRNVLSNIEDKKTQPEWEEVMNMILAHKTPSRGPTALELTLNKGQSTCESLRNQRIKKNFHLTKGIGLGNCSNIPVEARQNEFMPKSQNSTVKNPVITTNSYLQLGHMKVQEMNSNDSSIQSNIIKQPRVPTVLNNKSKMTKHVQSLPSKLQNVNPPINLKKIDRAEGKRLPGEIQKRHFTYTIPKQDDPFISGLPNSDYDLLEELMDDELRKEIGELSDDDFNMSANVSKDIKNMKQNESISKSVYNKVKISTSVIISPTRTDPKSDYENKFQKHKQASLLKPVKNFETPQPQPKSVTNVVQPIFERIDKNDTSKSFDKSQSQQKIVTNVVEPVTAERAENLTISRPAVIQGLSGNIIINKIAPKEYSAVNTMDRNILNVPEPSVYLIPPPTLSNVVLVGSNVYNTYSTVRTQVPVNSSNTTTNFFLKQPNISVYHSTQFAAPLVSPVIIGNAMPISTHILNQTPPATTMSVPKTFEPPPSSLNDPIKSPCVEDKVKLKEENCNISNNNSNSNITVDATTKSDKDICDIYLNKHCDRKILSQVQENHEDNDLGKLRNQRLCFDNKLIKEEKDRERLHKKRASIINRKVYHGHNNDPIPLNYTPLKPTVEYLEVNSSNVDQEKGLIVDLDSKTTHIDPKTENMGNLIMEGVSNQVAIDSKENDSSTVCRRILLRSSNKIQTNVSTVVVPKEASGRKTKVRLKVDISEKDVGGHVPDTVVVKQNLTSIKNNTVKRLNKVRNNRNTGLKKKMKQNAESKREHEKNKAISDLINSETKLENVLKSNIDPLTSKNPLDNKNEVTSNESSISEKRDIIENGIDTQSLGQDSSKVEDLKSNDSNSKKVEKIVIRKVNANKHEIASMITSNILHNNETCSINQEISQDDKSKTLTDKRSSDLEKTLLKIKHLLKPNIKQPTSIKILQEDKVKEKTSLYNHNESDIVAELEKTKVTNDCPIKSVARAICNKETNYQYMDEINTNELKEHLKSDKVASSQTKTNSTSLSVDDTKHKDFKYDDDTKHKDFIYDGISDTKQTTMDSNCHKKISLPKVEIFSSKTHENTNAEESNPVENIITKNLPRTHAHEPEKPNQIGSISMNKQLKFIATESVEAIIRQDNNDSMKTKNVSNIEAEAFTNKGLNRNDGINETKEPMVNTFEIKETSIEEINTIKPANIYNCIKTNHPTKVTVQSKELTQDNSITPDEKSISNTIDTPENITEHKEPTSNDNIGTKVSDVNIDFKESKTPIDVDFVEPKETMVKEIHSLKPAEDLTSISCKLLNGTKIDTCKNKMKKSDVACDNEVKDLNSKSDLVNKSNTEKIVNDVNCNKNPSTSDIKLNDTDTDKDDVIKDNISIEHLKNTPTNDPNKQRFRVKLPNKRTFIATIQGMHVDVNTLFSHPTFKSILLSNITENQRYTFNVKQALTIHANDRNKIETRIEEVSLTSNNNKPGIVETVSLLSDDEEEESSHYFSTEFGKYKIKPMNNIELRKHQEKFDQKCHVKLKIIGPESLKDPHMSNNESSKKIPDVIEIDDSSNDSVNVVPHLNEDINTLKDLLIKDLCAEIDLKSDLKNIQETSNLLTKKIAKCRECYVRLINCDNLLKTHELNVKSNKDCLTNSKIHDKKSSLNTACSADSHNTTNDYDIQVSNFDEGDVPVLSRSGSFSILSDFSLYDVDTTTIMSAENKDHLKLDRSSPVMEIYGVMAALYEQNQIGNSGTQFSKNVETITCDSDLFETKRKLHEFELKNSFNDCENDILLVKQEKSFDVPRLTNLMVSFFQTHNVVDYLRPINTSELFVLQKRPATLKRKFKTNEISDTTKVAKNTLVTFSKKSNINTLGKRNKTYKSNINDVHLPRNNCLITSTKNTLSICNSSNQIKLYTKDFVKKTEKEFNVAHNTSDSICSSNESENIVSVKGEIQNEKINYLNNSEHGRVSANNKTVDTNDVSKQDNMATVNGNKPSININNIADCGISLETVETNFIPGQTIDLCITVKNKTASGQGIPFTSEDQQSQDDTLSQKKDYASEPYQFEINAPSCDKHVCGSGEKLPTGNESGEDQHTQNTSKIVNKNNGAFTKFENIRNHIETTVNYQEPVQKREIKVLQDLENDRLLISDINTGYILETKIVHENDLNPIESSGDTAPDYIRHNTNSNNAELGSTKEKNYNENVVENGFNINIGVIAKEGILEEKSAKQDSNFNQNPSDVDHSPDIECNVSEKPTSLLTNRNEQLATLNTVRSSIAAHSDIDVVISSCNLDHEYVSFRTENINSEKNKCFDSSNPESFEYESSYMTEGINGITSDDDNSELNETIVSMTSCEIIDDFKGNLVSTKPWLTMSCDSDLEINVEYNSEKSIHTLGDVTNTDGSNNLKSYGNQNSGDFNVSVVDNKNDKNSDKKPTNDDCKIKIDEVLSPSILHGIQENYSTEIIGVVGKNIRNTLTVQDELVTTLTTIINEDVNIKPENCKTEFNNINISQDSKTDLELNVDSMNVSRTQIDAHIMKNNKVQNDMTDLKFEQENTSVSKDVTIDNPNEFTFQKECELKGIEYNDPEFGTCYVFNVVETISSDVGSNEVINESSNITGGYEESNTYNSEFQDNIEFNIAVTVPLTTYSRKTLDQRMQTNYNLHKKCRRALKRKSSSTDTRIERKYRKGKNIDYPKFTATAISESAYGKEYKQLIDYSSSVKFSYSRPFHKECIDVTEMLKNWPIKGTVNVDVTKVELDKTLFIDLEDICNPNIIVDPTSCTLAEEINGECNEVKLCFGDTKETNFNMGFGEESGRVIKNLDDGGDVSKFSAATLSDVKQDQPFLQSDDCEKNGHSTSKLDQVNVFKKYLTYIDLKEKVRAFFKKTTFDLNENWIRESKKYSCRSHLCHFPFDLNSTEFFEPPYNEFSVNVVQVGQLPVSAAAQNPVTCDPRVTQVSDASPSQCSAENTSSDDPQSAIKTEYTELTTADLSLPLQDYSQHDRSFDTLESQEASNLQVTNENIPIETEIKSIVKIELIEELPEDKEEPLEKSENSEPLLGKGDITNVDYNIVDSFDTGNINTSQDDSNFQMIFNSTEKQIFTDSFSQQKQQNGSSEKSDQIAHAMNAAGIITNADAMSSSRAHALVNILSQKIRQGTVNVASSQTPTNNFPKPPINAMALQQALAQILPPPVNQTNTETNQQASNTSVTPQVLHIVQGKNASGNQITLVDNSQQSVINSPSATPVLHIVQNKTVPTGSTSTATPTAQTNTFSSLSLVDTGLQQGGNQLLHIVNTGNQKTNNPGQLLKRVNLLTNLANVQGSNEQKMVQFVCKSADGKAIQLNAPHQRSMVLRLQPIETPNVQTNVQKPIEPPDLNSNSASAVINKESVTSQQEIKSRSIYEENYAKFIQNSSTKPIAPEKATSLPKFNQAFGKQVFQDGSQKNEINNGGNMPPAPTNTNDNVECPQTDNAINLEHINQINSPPLLLRKTPVSTSQATQPNLVQQIKQTIAPMNLQTMHGGVIYTRQIPVNIGGGQTINLITVPSTELIDDNIQKQQADVKFVSQGEIEPSIIKIVPQSQPAANGEVTQDENSSHLGVSTENTHTPQPQPVLTQMRIKLPMLSKTPQMVSGARVVRPSFFQIQRNVIGGANQPVYQQLVLTAAPQLGQQTIRLPQTPRHPVKVPSETQSSTETQMSSSTLEQLREFDLVLEQVKERSTVQPNSSSNSTFSKLHTPSTDTTDSSASVSSTSTESTQQVLYSIGNNQPMNVSYVNRKETVTTPTTSTFVRSPDSSGIADSPTSSNHVQISHTVTAESSTSDTPVQTKPSKVSSKSKSRPKSSSNPPNTLKLNTVPPKTSTQKPLEDEQTTQRILYILAEYKEQVENSPDKDKPAPRRRSNPPSNPSGSSKRKKSSSGSRRPGRDVSPVHGDDTCRTMGSEDSSCGTSQGDCNESYLESHSPQDSPRKVVRKLTFEHETPAQTRPQPQRNVIVADGQTITVARGATGKPATAVLMPANYILPVSMVKGGQQIAIVTNRGPKLLTVGGGEGGATNALLLQRLIGPAGLKPVLARPGVRHVRLPTAALHNLQAFNLATATTIQPPDSTASPAQAPTPPELLETRAASSPWTDRESQEVKPERGSSPEGSEPWNLPSSADAHDYSYEETVAADSMNRTVLDPIPDRYSPDMEAQRIFDKMFDVDSKKSYIVDSPRCGYDIDTSDCDDKGYHQKKDGPSHRQQRLTHVSAAALRHKYAILEHELRLQKSLSEECEDLGVDSPSASELFPEAELLFAASPAHDHTQEHAIHSHTPQPTLINPSSIPQPDMDDQIATDQLLSRADDLQDRHDLNLGLEDVGIVTVSEDGMQATIALDQEEFARAHPNTTFHSEPTDDGEVQPFTLSGIKGRHITSTIFHNRAPGTVLMSAPQTTVISQVTGEGSGVPNAVKYADIDNMINSLPTHGNINLSSVLVKDDGLTRFDSILNDSRELHLSSTASAVVHSAGNATQVIRRVCYDDDKRDNRYLMDEPDVLIAGDDAKMTAEDSSREALDSMAGDDDRSSPERHAELFWESNSASERSESRRVDFSSDSDKCCKSPSFDETNSTDSSGVGTHMRLNSVIKEARGIERSGSADGSSADDTHPPLRTYPPKRMYHAAEGEVERSMSGKTRAGERSPDSLEVRRRASGRGVVKRGCHCCNGSPAPPRPKKSRQRKPAMDFSSNN